MLIVLLPVCPSIPLQTIANYWYHTTLVFIWICSIYWLTKLQTIAKCRGSFVFNKYVTMSYSVGQILKYIRIFEYLCPNTGYSNTNIFSFSVKKWLFVQLWCHIRCTRNFVLPFMKVTSKVVQDRKRHLRHIKEY